MASVVKVAGGGAAVLGGGSAVGYGVKKFLEKAPTPILLSAMENLESIYESTKYGNTGDNKNSFVDPDKSKDWWDWVYENEFKVNKENNEKKKGIHSNFESVNKSYATGEGTEALNQVCKAAFKKEPKEITNIKYKTNIWTYCSKDRKAPSNINDMPRAYVLNNSESSSHTISGTNVLGSIEDNKGLLISDISQNEEVWNWIYENKLNVDKLDSSKSSDIDSNFNAVTSGYSSTSGNTSLNQVCKTAYEKGSSDLKGDSGKEKYKKNIEAYCAKSGTEGSLKVPEN